MNDETTNNPHKNPDPITGEPGSHPIGTSAGAASGGAAGATIGAALGGPIGAVVGVAVGGIVGAYSGHEVAEAINPTEEDAYWREHHAKQKYADKDYEYYAPAYRTGYESGAKYAGQKFEEIETDLALDYEKNRAGSALPWDEAQHATRAAFSRISGVVAPRDTSRGMRGGI